VRTEKEIVAFVTALRKKLPKKALAENQETIKTLPKEEEDDDEPSEEILEIFRKRKEEKNKDPLRDWSCKL
jgi:hypothetical protein